MDRRQFLQTLTAAGLTAALPQALWARAETDTFTVFSAARKHNPWLAGWATLDADALPRRALKLHGTLPDGLRGTLYRNGPGRFDRAGFRYQQWFDGDGLVQAWRLQDKGITHEARFVETTKYVAERKAGRFIYPAVGTVVPDARPIGNADGINTANTRVISFDSQLLALWEGGSAWQLDADDLSGQGAKAWSRDTTAVPFSAHPLREKDGSLWNFGSMPARGDGTLIVWRIGADGRLRSFTPIDTAHRGYIHSFAITERHLLFVLAPLMLQPGRTDKPYFQSMQWESGQASLLLIVDKHNPSKVQRAELPAGMAFHWVTARDTTAGVSIRGAWTTRGDILMKNLRTIMQGKPFDPDSRSTIVRIDVPRSGPPRIESEGITGAEFPDFDRRFNDGRGRIYALARPQDNASGYLDTVATLNPDNGHVHYYRYGDHHLAEEHRFVPRHDHAARDDGWLVGTVMDYKAGTMALNVLDAAHIENGPICTATLPQTLPLSFHASFVPS